MRERKHIFLLAFLAVLVGSLATSCKTNEEEARKSIHFGTQTITRAAIITQQDLENASLVGGQHIGIYGTVSDALNPTPVEIITNEPLYFDDESGEWDYTNTRYWVPGANHEFVAIFPHTADEYTWDSETGTITRNNITLGVANNTDYMWASASRNLATNPDTTTPVLLQMHHACALVEFWFVNASSHAIGSITEISLADLHYRGNLTCSKDGSSNMEVINDDSGSYAGNLTATNMEVNLSIHYNLFDNLGDPSAEVYDNVAYCTRKGSGALVVMPQKIAAGDVTLTLKFPGEDPTTINLSQMSSVTEWEAGHKYVYTLARTTTDITFDVRVLDWIDDNVEL